MREIRGYGAAIGKHDFLPMVPNLTKFLGLETSRPVTLFWHDFVVYVLRLILIIQTKSIGKQYGFYQRYYALYKAMKPMGCRKKRVICFKLWRFLPL